MWISGSYLSLHTSKGRAEFKYVINSDKLYKWDTDNVIMQELKVTSVIWIIAFTRLGPRLSLRRRGHGGKRAVPPELF